MRRERKYRGYMPFMMIGSWIGFFVGLIPFQAFIFKNTGVLIYKLVSIANPVYWWYEINGTPWGSQYLIAISNPFIYFIHGWIIHSFFRSKRKPPVKPRTNDIYLEAYGKKTGDYGDQAENDQETT